MIRKSNASTPANEQPTSLLAPTPRVSSSSSRSSSVVVEGSNSNEVNTPRSSLNNPRSVRSPSSNTFADSNSPSPPPRISKSPSASSLPSPLNQVSTSPASTLTNHNSSSLSSCSSSSLSSCSSSSLSSSSSSSLSSSSQSSPKHSSSDLSDTPPPLPTSEPPPLPASDPPALRTPSETILSSNSAPSSPTAASKRMLRPAASLPASDPQSEFYSAVAESDFGTSTKAVEEAYLRHSVSAVHRVSVAVDKHEAQQQTKLNGALKKQEVVMLSSKSLSAKKDKPVKAPAPALVIKKAVTLDLSTPMYVDRWGDVHAGERKEELTAAQMKKITKQATNREAKWLAMAARWREVSTKNKSQLRRRIRKGIPDSLRPLVWPHLCCSAIEKSKPENRFLYQHLLTQEIAAADDEQIRKDLPRAFQTHVMFKSPEAGSRDVVCIGQAALYNILKAYSIRHSAIGYVQGMTGLAGLCLMYLPEEDAYWMLEVLLSGVGESEGLSRLYEKGMPLAFEYLAIYESLLRKRLPVLADHLQSLGVLPTSYAFRWLTTRFALFPKGLMIRIFDIFLHEGMKIIYRVCLYLMTRFAKDLLKLDYEGVSTLLESIKTHPSMYEEDEVIRGALKIKLKGKMLAEMSRVYRAGVVETKEEPPTPKAEGRPSKNT